MGKQKKIIKPTENDIAALLRSVGEDGVVGERKSLDRHCLYRALGKTPKQTNRDTTNGAPA